MLAVTEQNDKISSKAKDQPDRARFPFIPDKEDGLSDIRKEPTLIQTSTIEEYLVSSDWLGPIPLTGLENLLQPGGELQGGLIAEDDQLDRPHVLLAILVTEQAEQVADHQRPEMLVLKLQEVLPEHGLLAPVEQPELSKTVYGVPPSQFASVEQGHLQLLLYFAWESAGDVPRSQEVG